MAKYRSSLPQLAGDIFLTDAGLETDLIFNHGIEIREFAAHTLLPDEAGRQAIADYFRGFLKLAAAHNTGFILDSTTWKAHAHWAKDLGASEAELRAANHDSIGLCLQLREEFAGNAKPIVVGGVIGPRGDAYAPESLLSAKEAEDYHAQQVGWLAETEADMVTALTFTQAEEAAGITAAAAKAGLPIVVSFTVETDGALPTGQSLSEAINEVDAATNNGPAYYMINCAHPDHFADVVGDGEWRKHIRGVRCNASRRSHAELDEADALDAGDPVELASQYRELAALMPWLNVFGGCCGSDLRHVTKIAGAIAA